MDEREGVEAGRGAIAGTSQGTEVGGWGRADGSELSAKQAAVEEISGAGSGGAAAPERGEEVATSQSRRVSGEGAAPGAEEVRRGSGRAVRADAGGGASGIGR